MRIRILGCSGGITNGARTSSMLVDDDVLIDAGTGVGELTQAELEKVRHVFLTHSHLVHIAGLPMFIDSIFKPDFNQPITVYGRRETLQAVQQHLFNWVIWPDFAALPSPDRPILRYQLCDPGTTVQIRDRELHSIDVAHSIPALGYTVTNSNGVLGISGDTKTNRTLWPELNLCDDLRALIVEVSFPNEQAALAERSGHYCPATLATDLAQLQGSPEIWLTAMKPGNEDTILDEALLALPDYQVKMLTTGSVITL